MSEASSERRLIGRAELVHFPELEVEGVPARIDTGARTSAIWASDVEIKDGVLTCVFFGPEAPFYTGKRIAFEHFEEQMVASSNGIAEKRFKVKLLIKLKGKKVRAAFTLANRSTQVYPILIGRNVLLGKFIVDVKKGHPDREAERQRIDELQARLKEL
jgi:hypothetical protein